MDWFATRLLAWYRRHGRKDLPWQRDITPYRVWVSEIMLQQTQVTTVVGYYERFMRRFPGVETLAEADLDEVLHLWTGLGYYARARNLHKAARLICDECDGRFPDAQEALERLPGIGRSTAGAIRAIALNERAPILDGNVKRVLARFHNIAGYPGETSVGKALWAAADAHTPSSETRAYTQAIMDLGATLCTRREPDCPACPLRTRCEANAAGTVATLPTPKPKKAKPLQSVRMFVVTTPAKAALLEKRPTSGVWGGLWTPPQRPADTVSDDFLAEHGLRRDMVEREHVAPVFRHTFTHYRLDIEPVYLHLREQPTTLHDRDHTRWVLADATGVNERIGLARPAVKLLESLKDTFPA